MNTKQRAISLLILFCIVLFLIRSFYTQSIFLGFLLWNIVLATIPYIASEYLQKVNLSKIKTSSIICIWLLFLPNSPYIITDFIHLHNSESTLIWYDLFMVFSFAFTGLLLAIISMYDIYLIIQQKWSLKTANLSIIIISFLCGYGIYLGRFLRLNSWYIFTKPVNTLQQIATSLLNQQAWYISLGFGALLYLIFYVFKTFQPIKASGL